MAILDINVDTPYYHTSNDEEFMNDSQKEYFRNKLLNWRTQLLNGSEETLGNLQKHNIQESDITDRASNEINHSLEFKTRDRERKLISKINAALERINNGTYGYCEKTHEPIGLKRLEARPIATLSIKAQEQHERMEKVRNTHIHNY